MANNDINININARDNATPSMRRVIDSFEKFAKKAKSLDNAMSSSVPSSMQLRSSIDSLKTPIGDVAEVMEASYKNMKRFSDFNNITGKSVDSLKNQTIAFAKAQKSSPEEALRSIAKYKSAIDNFKNLQKSYASNIGNYFSGVFGRIRGVFGRLKNYSLGLFRTIAFTARGAIETIGRSIVSTGIQYVDQIDTYRTTMTTYFKEGNKSHQAAARIAENTIKKAQRFAIKTPLDTAGVMRSINTLVQYGQEADVAYDVTTRLADVSGGDSKKMHLLGLAMSQVSAKAKLQGEEVRQLTNAGYNPLKTIAKATGESMEDLYERMKAGKISFEEVAEALKKDTDAGGKFHGNVKALSRTMSGAIANMKEMYTAISGSVMESAQKKMKGVVLEYQDYMEILADSVISGKGFSNGLSLMTLDMQASGGHAAWLAGKIEWLRGAFDNAKYYAGFFADRLKSGSGVVGALKETLTQMEAYGGSLGQFAGQTNSAITVMERLGNIVKTVTRFTKDHWKIMVSAAVGVKTFIAVYKGTTAIMTFVQAMKAARAATLALGAAEVKATATTVALKTAINPLGGILTGLLAAGAAGGVTWWFTKKLTDTEKDVDKVIYKIDSLKRSMQGLEGSAESVGSAKRNRSNLLADQRDDKKARDELDKAGKKNTNEWIRLNNAIKERSEVEIPKANRAITMANHRLKKDLEKNSQNINDASKQIKSDTKKLKKAKEEEKETLEKIFNSYMDIDLKLHPLVGGKGGKASMEEALNSFSPLGIQVSGLANLSNQYGEAIGKVSELQNSISSTKKELQEAYNASEKMRKKTGEIGKAAQKVNDKLGEMSGIVQTQVSNSVVHFQTLDSSIKSSMSNIGQNIDNAFNNLDKNFNINVNVNTTNSGSGGGNNKGKGKGKNKNKTNNKTTTPAAETVGLTKPAVEAEHAGLSRNIKSVGGQFSGGDNVVYLTPVKLELDGKVLADVVARHTIRKAARR